jgi:hypothetical protein
MTPVFAFFFFYAAKIRFLYHAANFGSGNYGALVEQLPSDVLFYPKSDG